MSVVIRNFGNDTECYSVSDFKEALINKYQNMSVSIVYKKKSGLTSFSLVDVQKDGSLIGSQCKKSIELSFFNFNDGEYTTRF